MRIKELSLLGFKSFATRTRMVFPAGLTAIVGPNGSGKSNVSDAVRWALGEARPTALRARSADEMIFAGTEKRPRGGLCEVSLTIDNEDGTLDIGFPEVVITRRAERDGPIQYMINGAKVRLRDILDLLGGQLGQSNYTVIGQGMVDQFLSMRASERRELIDEAAGITPLQRRRDATLRKLADTRDDLVRVRDILSEIGPRLRRMERLAERARRHEEVGGQLSELLATWYGHQFGRAEAALREAVDRSAEREAERTAAIEAVRAAEVRRAEADDAAEELESTWTEARDERDELARQLAASRQAAAVTATRIESLVARRREMTVEAERAERERSELEERRTELAEEVEQLERTHSELEEAVRAARAAVAEKETEREAHASELEEAREEELALRSARSARAARRASIEEDLAARTQERRRTAERLESLDADLVEHRRRSDAAEAAWAEMDRALRSVAADIAEAEDQQRSLTEAVGAAREALGDTRAELEALKARAAALEALFAEVGTGEDVLARLRETERLEILGTVAELVEIEPQWEAAVAAALGSRVRGVVVRTQSDVDRGLMAIRDDEESGASFVPLDRPDLGRSAWRPEAGELPAADVATSPSDAALVRALLGETAFVEDVSEGRRALARPDGPRRAATRSGALVEPGGVVTLASGARDVLAIARERRGLPDAIAAAEQRVAEHRERVDALGDRRRQLEERIGTLSESREEHEAERDARTVERDEARRALERAERERAWALETAERLDSEIGRLAGERDELEALDERDAGRMERVEQRVAEARSALEDSDPSDERQALADAGARAAEVAQGLAAKRARLEAATRELEETTRRGTEAATRIEVLDERLARLGEDRGTSDEEGEDGAEALERLESRIQRAQQRMREARDELREASTAADQARRAQSAVEARLGDARVAVARAEDRVERLEEQLASDAELLEPILDVALPSESTDPPAAERPDGRADGEGPRVASTESDMVEATGDPAEDGASEDRAVVSALRAALPTVDSPPDDLAPRVRALRKQLRSIGAIDRDALDAYEETAERHAFLTEQLADLETADHDLRDAIRILDEDMARRFGETFEAVAEAFERFFPRLFGGGDARLTFAGSPDDPDGGGDGGSSTVGDDDDAPGIEIMARPPGKRRQPLALLSGGERALTAVALLFALLEVSGTPFVVLDEVDAALDEANVDRFRTCLETLVDDMQVVIITHNRATVQSANTVYGVTMGEDGASRMVSLRVDEAA